MIHKYIKCQLLYTQNEVLNLPWKSPETTMGPNFYPIINDVLWIKYHNWHSHYIINKKGYYSDGFRYHQYGSTRCEKFNNYFQSVKSEMSYAERYRHEILYDVNTEHLCKELSFYCVNLKTGNLSGPWENTTIFKAREKCKSLGSSIKTFDLNDRFLDLQSIWTGSTRHNQ